MLRYVISWSLHNPFLVLLTTVVLVIGGSFALTQMPLDALPDLSDPQVIIYTEFPGQAPQVVEDQITYPLTTAMLSVPRSKVVRGFSFFGASFVYIIFEDNTDIYWARSRILEYLTTLTGRLPKGVAPQLGPDASGIGWVYHYALVAKNHTLAELRTLQDWYIRYPLSHAKGVSEVASVGGYVQQYQVTVNPHQLQAYRIPLRTVTDAISNSNRDVGGRTLELAETEYMIRGRGYLQSSADIEKLVLKTENGIPVLISDIARVELVPDERRGITEWNGEGEAVSGIALARYGQNALEVIEQVKQRLQEITTGLPEGVSVQPVYDRSGLILRAIDNLRQTLLEESAVVAGVCILFLMHIRSALVAIIMLPVGVLIAFIIMQRLGINANIMSLGGIAIAIGAMVDAAIVMIENVHKHLERDMAQLSRAKIIRNACQEVGPALFFSLLIITVSFLPVFALEAQEGRLFHPLAYTKTFSMAGAALLSITLVPVLIALFVRGKIPSEQQNPINRSLIRLYRPLIASVMRHKIITILLAVLIMAGTAYPIIQLGGEFMPTLNEGTLLFMPQTLPGITPAKAEELLQTQDRIIKTFPEVESVFGKAGRALTATDPAPLEMSETIINLKPETAWRSGMTVEKLIAEMDKALQIPGVSNAWTMPIKNRIDMLATGIRTPIGIKLFGKDIAQMERLAQQIEHTLKQVPGTTSAYAERSSGGYYLTITPDYPALARYGLLVGDIQDLIANAIGGERVSTLVEGRERFAIIVRYPRELRDSPQALAKHLLITTPGGITLPLGQLVHINLNKGPAGIRTENALLSLYVYVDMRGKSIASYVKTAQQAVAQAVKFPPGYYMTWSGQFEYMERAKARLQVVVPLTLGIIFALLFLNFRRLTETLIVMLSLPFALVGGIWLISWLNYNMSVAVGVGFIALAGVSAETGVIMLMYLEQAYRDKQQHCQKAGRAVTTNDLHTAIMTGSAERLRPKLMTVTAIMAGLLPIIWSNGTGSEVMRRIAAPMVGGMVSSTLLTLIVIPALYALCKQKGLSKSPN